MIRNKVQMYELLSQGAFGNTIPQYFDVPTWQASADYHRYLSWGIRAMIPGGLFEPYVPRQEVHEAVLLRRGQPVNISPMLDTVCDVTLWADVYDSPTGLMVYGVEFPGKGESWRQGMPRRGREFRGLAARNLLRRYLNPSTLADLEATLERWPGHVVELSALDRCLGTIPGRNAVVWECRGSY